MKTQIELAREGIISEQMQRVAQDEGFTGEVIRQRVADGHIVIPVSPSRPHQKDAPDFINQWVSWGAGLRASQYLVLGAKVRGLLMGRSHVTLEDIRGLAHPVLRHRILTNYRAEAEGMSVDKIVDRLLETVTERVKP